MAVLLIVVVLVGTGAGYLAGNANERTVTFASTITRTSTTTFIGSTTVAQTTSYLAVEILSVQLKNQTVGSQLSLNVTFKNVGNVPIFYCPNCGLPYTVDPTNATKRVAASCPPPMGIPAFAQEVAPGQSASLYSAPCYKDEGTGQFVADEFAWAGIVRISAAVNWYADSAMSTGYNSTAVQTFSIV